MCRGVDALRQEIFISRMNHAVGRRRKKEGTRVFSSPISFSGPPISLLKRGTERPLLFCGAKVSFTFNSAGRGERARDSAAEEAIERADADDRTQLKAER